MHRTLPVRSRSLLAAAFLLATLATKAFAVTPPGYISQWGSLGAGNGQFNEPAGVALDASGNVYVADTNNHRVQKFTANGTYITQWGGLGSGNGQFSGPFGLTVAGGTVYVVDTFNQRVQMFTLAGAYAGQWGSNGTGNGQFSQPLCVAVDAAGDVYVTDYNLNRVQKFTSTGTYLMQWGSTGTGVSQFTGAAGICVDGFQNVMVTDAGNARVEIFDTNGNYVTDWGFAGTGNGQFMAPLGIATDGADAYVVDTSNHRMQIMYNVVNLYLGQWGSLGAGNGQFNQPHSAAIGGGFVYVCDTENHRIQKFGFTPPEECANCQPLGDPCCAAKPTVGGPWSNLLVTTRNANIAPVFPYAVTIFDLNASPLPAEDNDWASMTRYHGPGNTWTTDTLGTVFGLTLDEYGNIFVGHTSCYIGDAIGTLAGGAPGAIYRIDGATGAMNTFVVLPNVSDPSITPIAESYPGLGNLTYDCNHQQFFVTNLEDGKIYRIKTVGVNGTTGTVVQTFDPLAPDNGLPGFAPVGERLWGVQWHRDRVYYSVWARDPGAGAGSNEIRSVALLPSGAIDPTSDQHEIFLPALAGATWSMPVADISFSSGGKMLLGERGINHETEPYPHAARVLEYACSGGCWVPANQYRIGVYGQQTNAEGGVDYDPQPFGGPTSPIGRVWATADAMHFQPPHLDTVYGWQGLRPNLAFGTYQTSMLVDGDGVTNGQDKAYIGDVEVPGCPPGSTLGSICGHKFSDQNRNGVADGLEPGLGGWTITLTGPGGPYTAITDASGAYCFTNLAPGNYVVAETQQATWIQTGPAGGTHAVTLAAGQNVTARDFGNYSCAGGAGSCAQPPPSMVAWWPFAEAIGSTSTKDVTHLTPPRNVMTLFGGAAVGASGKVARGVCFANEGQYGRVPISNQIATNWGASPFAIDAWINPLPGGAPGRMIAEKRTLISPSPYRTIGWALYLNGMQLFLELGNSATTQVYAGPTLSASTWSHIAVSVDRSPAAGRWYVNGVVQPSFNFVPLAGSVSNSSDIWVGQSSPPFGVGPGLMGCLDEIQILSTPTPPASILPAATVAAIAAAGSTGKCPDVIRMPSVTTICKDDSTVKVCFNVCNTSPSTQSYHWSATALAAGPGCTVNGPVTFAPGAGTLTVPAGTCSAPVCIVMPRPAGLTAQNATACFSVSVVNDSTGACQSFTSTIRADNTCWCITPVANNVVPVGRAASGLPGTGVVIGIKYPCPPIASPLRITANWLGTDHADPLLVSLNGLPPGEPVIGTLEPQPGQTEHELTVFVNLPNGHDAAALYEIVLEADTDGDGTFERQAATPIVSTYDEAESNEVPPAGVAFAQSVKLALRPNPFHSGSAVGFTLSHAQAIDLAIYDVTGRRVRTLKSGMLTAGPHSFEWNGLDGGGRRVAAGIYFVRFQAAGRSLEAKLVKLQ